MIRRKLTRIEVTLDDTKEVDDLLNKTSQTSLSLGLSAQNSASKLTANFFQKQLILSGKQQQQQETLLQQSNNNNNNNSSIEFSIPVTTSAANNNNNESANTVTAPQPSDTTESPQADRLTFNPQPYNPSSRFNLNQESQR